MTTQSKRPLPGNPVMSINEPPEGATVGPTFSVYGTCDGLGPDSDIVITVTLTLTSGNTIYTFQRQAMINADYQTWEAIFDNIPPSSGASGSVTANCTGIGSASIDSLTVVSTSTTTVEINEPLDGEAFGTLDPSPQAAEGGGPPQPASPIASGKRGSSHAVTAYATRAGYNVTPSSAQPPTTDAPGLVGETHNWSYNLQSLLPSPPAPGTYVLHITTTYGSKTFYQVSGTFVFNPNL